MKLKKFLLRYHPPGIGLEYSHHNETKVKMIDLLNFTASSDVNELADEVIKTERLVTESVRPKLVSSLEKLKKKLFENSGIEFVKHQTLTSHLLPLTNVEFNHQGTRCVTGSYDRTCKLWDVETGANSLTLYGHTNAIFTAGFNHPHDNRILTGSFDKTARIWDSETGEELKTLTGHTGEVAVLKYQDDKRFIATTSMDSTAIIYDFSSGFELFTLANHCGPVVSAEFAQDGNTFMTGSFDSTVRLWDLRFPRRQIGVLGGHKAEISCCKFNFNCDLIATSSLDGTAKIWDSKTLGCLNTVVQENEVLDVSFDCFGQKLVSSSVDGSVYIWDVRNDLKLIAKCTGHGDEVSKVCFSPNGETVLSCSADGSAMIWDSQTGQRLQILEGHQDEIFSSSFSYLGDNIVTASKDNTCILWRKKLLTENVVIPDAQSKQQIKTNINFGIKLNL